MKSRIQEGFFYRTFDNGHIDLVIHNGKTVGVRAILQPAVPLRSAGLLSRISKDTATSHYKHGDDIRSELDAFDPEYAEVTYSLDAP